MTAIILYPPAESARLARALLASHGFLFGADQSARADVQLTRLTDKFATLAISETISKADTATIRALVKELRPTIDVIEVELNSRGGDLAAAMDIGELVRSEWLWTTVP